MVNYYFISFTKKGFLTTMIELELPEIHQDQQDVDLIDILWRQDVDLGACREVFDISHRQKEHERRRQQELEEEEQQQRLREQENVLLAQLQLDEETGEFVPRRVPSQEPMIKASQDVMFAEEDRSTLSFDECMLLLEETFPLVETIETASLRLDPSAPSAAGEGGHVGMAPHQLPQANAPPQPLQVSDAPVPEKALLELEQSWLELLSIPELQECLNTQTSEVGEPSGYMSTNSLPHVEDPGYVFYLPSLADPVVNPEEEPSGFMGTFEGALSAAVPPDKFSQISLEVSDPKNTFITDSLCSKFYPELSTSGGEKGRGSAAELPREPSFEPIIDVPEFMLEGFKPEGSGEFPDSDSGLSLETSPKSSSLERLGYVEETLGYSDSDMEERGGSPSSAQSDYAGSILTIEGNAFPASPSAGADPAQLQSAAVQWAKAEPTEGYSHCDPPFTKDKPRKHRDSRCSRDEQRARALRLPFSVDNIINLPVDDFNEKLSRQRLDEAQLALVRDIRRRGKNKVAAQNCRKRKMESVTGLESELVLLRERKELLLQDRARLDSGLKEARHKLRSLYQEVFTLLCDEEGNPYSPGKYSLQQSAHGDIFLVPRVKKTQPL